MKKIIAMAALIFSSILTYACTKAINPLSLIYTPTGAAPAA